MCSFFKKISLFAFIAILLAATLQFIIYMNYETQIYDEEDWHTLKNKNYDFLLIGNSRTMKHLNPEIWGKTLKMKGYCLAQRGYTLDVLYAKLNVYLKDNIPPKIIFLQLDPTIIHIREDIYSKETFIKYFYLDRLGINAAFENKKGFHCLETYIPLLTYRGYFSTFVRHLFNIKSEKLKNELGFYTLKEPWNTSAYLPDEWVFRKEYFFLISKFQDLAERLNIKLICHFPPVTDTMYERIKGMENILMFLENNQLLFINWNQYDFYGHQEYFVNNAHLNHKGVELLNNYVKADLINLIDKASN